MEEGDNFKCLQNFYSQEKIVAFTISKDNHSKSKLLHYFGKLPTYMSFSKSTLRTGLHFSS